MEWVKKRVNMRVLSVFLLVIAIPVIVYSAWNVRAVHVCVVRQQEIEQSRRMCEANSQNLANASDYLTEEVWRFVATGDTENLNNYWNEVDNIRNRDKAIKELETLKLTDEEMELVNIAKAESDLLIDGEAKAMRLVAESIGMKTEEMPPQVASVELTALESRMTAKEKRAAAADYIFGAEYEAGKDLITDSLNRFRRMLRSRKDEEVKAAMAETERALALAQSDNAAVLLLLAAALVSFYLLVLKPFLKYSVALRRADGTSPVQLVPAGSAEVREFASVFNHVYSQWQEQNERLKELNAIDSLTGAANRETLYRYLEDLIGKKQGNIGVFMLDIDSFKSFNDAYGHLSGDEVLAKIGHFLNTIMAEVHGLASRVGGEEFALVVPVVQRMLITAGVVQMTILFQQPIMPLYVAELQGSMDRIVLVTGILFSAVGLSGVFASPVWGIAGQKWGYRPVLYSALLGTTIFGVIQAIPNDLWQFGFWRFIGGLAFAGIFPAINAVLTNSTEPEDRGRIFGLSYAAQQIGSVIGPIAGGALGMWLGLKFVIFFSEC